MADDERCNDRTKSPRGWLRCTLPAGHDKDPLSMHTVDFDEVEVEGPCACGSPDRENMDHSRFCCVTLGFFTEEDWKAIARAARDE